MHDKRTGKYPVMITKTWEEKEAKEAKDSEKSERRSATDESFVKTSKASPSPPFDDLHAEAA